MNVPFYTYIYTGIIPEPINQIPDILWLEKETMQNGICHGTFLRFVYER